VLMSAKDLANYLEQRVAMLGLSKSEAARRADISRQTWYRLLSADVTDAKLSTMVSLAEALETTPMHLLRLYFGEETVDETAYSHAVSANNHRSAQA
jgi:hypothetical protein